MVKRFTKKIRTAEISEEVQDVILNRSALTQIKEIANTFALQKAFPKNLDKDQLQYWLMFNALEQYLGIRKVPVPFKVMLESEDR